MLLHRIRYWFQLGTGRYRNSQLQGAWKQHGEEAFSFEVLEQFDDEISALLINDLYSAGKKHWAEKLSAHVL